MYRHPHQPLPPAGYYPAPTQPGMTVTFPDPPPVSAPPWPQPAAPPVDNLGPKYGIQAFQQWNVGETDERGILDTIRADFVWRISIVGHVLATIEYGTSHNRELLKLQGPVVIAVPGQAVVRVVPFDGNGATCTVTLTKATGSALAQARNIVNAGTGAVALDPAAVRYVALTASTLTISGITPVAVPALSSVPLVASSSLLTGSGFQEFEA